MDEVNQEILEQYEVKSTKETPFVLPKDPEPMLKQLIFLLRALIERGYTLSAICPSDFVLRDKVLFLKRDTHVTKLVDGHFVYKESQKCFPPGKPGRHSLVGIYGAVGLFAYYLWTHKKVDSISEIDYGKLKGTKIYYFIRNSIEKNPILLYL